MAKEPKNVFDCLAVSSVSIFPINPLHGISITHTVATAEVVFNDQLIIRGIRVKEGENGLYITYPCTFMPTMGDDGFKSSVLPITKALRDHVEAVVIEKYQDAVKKENE